MVHQVLTLSRIAHPPRRNTKMDRPGLAQVARSLTTAGTKASIIHADDFCEFVKEHGRAVASRRLTYEALWFVQNYVFPPSHAELLSVRGTYKRHDTDDETDPNTESQSACGSEEDGGQEG